MIITLVMDQYGIMNNGTTATARYLAERMRAHGHTVRIVTCIPSDEENVYVTKERYYPIITKIIRSNGMALAKPDEKILEEAIRGADIVHFFVQFKLAQAGKTIADRLGVPSTAAFHFQPENVSYNIGFGLGKSKFFNEWLYRHYKKFFNRFAHIHVPSENMKRLLIEHGYKSEIHAISNGVNDVFRKMPSARPPELENKYLIMMSGRLAAEKRQEVLLEAVGKSKYNDKIQVILCGKGHCEKKLRKLSNKVLKNPVLIKFCKREELIETINYCDLYVHTSEIESEAIACMEAFVCGLVPIISDASMSATKQFALHEENLFRNGDSDQLAEKIDWFIENPDRKAEMEKEYLEFAENFRLENCVSTLERVFTNVIEENRKRLENIELEKNYLSDLTEKDIKRYYKRKIEYQELALKYGQPDYLDEYINCELPETEKVFR